MAKLTSILPVPRSYASPNCHVFVRYEAEGWHAGVLSTDMKTVAFDGVAYDFDLENDEFVESTAFTRSFLTQHAGSLLVRIAQSEIEYLVSDGGMTVESLLTMINALLFRAGRAQLPPVETDHGEHVLYDAAKMCARGVLELTTV